MNTKLLTGACCMLLLAAAFAPTVLGHDERSSFGSANGVSGRYYGAAGPAVVNAVNFPDTLSAGAILCDMEVSGDGTAPSPQDEALVDGALGGSVPNIIDDGGQGGACHANHYLFGPYNTPGCPADTANAANAAGPVFLGAACDWKTVEGGTPQSDILLLCIVNSVLSGQVLNVVDCLLTFLACLGNPTGCTSDGNEFCGSDGSADGINYGYGSAPYPTAAADQGSVALDLDFDQDGTVDGACAGSDATAQVFVFDAVDTCGNVTPAGTGEIWTGGPQLDLLNARAGCGAYCAGPYVKVLSDPTIPFITSSSTTIPKVTGCVQLSIDNGGFDIQVTFQPSGTRSFIVPFGRLAVFDWQGDTSADVSLPGIGATSFLYGQF